jgi:REP element-mobilizing transposase RayT
MARKLRIHFPGAVYHVILRGNAGEPVFFDEEDRFRFYLLMQEGIEKYGYRVHAFCCMTNHIHMALQVGDIPLSRIMQNLALRYTTWINHKKRRTGHLFQGRYKAILLDADSYLLELVRYMHLNPVRADMVMLPEDYPWSGHRAYLGKEELPWLTTDWILSLFSAKSSVAQKGYIEFVAEGMDEPRRPEFHSGSMEGRILGDDCFANDVLLKANQRRQQPASLEVLLDAVCQYYRLARSELSAAGKVKPHAEARAVSALLVRESAHYSLTELGRLLNRDVAALSQAARRLAEQLYDNQILRLRVDELRERSENV